VGQQQQLFEDEAPVSVSDRVETNKLHVSRSTFLGGLASKVHRWFRLTPSFGPELVQRGLADMETKPGSVVFDPFSGAGTTLIEAKLEGHEAIGFEINPLLQFVCTTCLEWGPATASLEDALASIQDGFRTARESAGSKPPEELGLPVPTIHNVHRWWREDVLRDLMLLVDQIGRCSTDEKVVNFFRLTLAGVLVPNLTNVTLGRLQLHFIDRSKHVINVWDTFDDHARSMIADLAEVQQLTNVGRGRVLHCDSTKPNFPADLPPIDRVFTSPPYPNRYSYVWNTRPHLFMLGFFDSAKQASQLDLSTIGGTWGTATSVLMKGIVEPETEAVAEVVKPVADEIRPLDNLMANYLMKYFNKLAEQIVAQDPYLASDAMVGYVVGCSRLKGVYVETDVLLGKVIEKLDLGYSTTKIDRFRRRHSGKDLHESTVYARK
jgi:hypothetical protein